jgi:hypothetical protein
MPNANNFFNMPRHHGDKGRGNFPAPIYVFNFICRPHNYYKVIQNIKSTIPTLDEILQEVNRNFSGGFTPYKASNKNLTGFKPGNPRFYTGCAKKTSAPASGNKNPYYKAGHSNPVYRFRARKAKRKIKVIYEITEQN